MTGSTTNTIVARLRSNRVAKKAGAKGNGVLDDLAARVLDIKKPGSKLDMVERAIVSHALEAADGNVSQAARLLGIDRKAMERRIAGFKLRR